MKNSRRLLVAALYGMMSIAGMTSLYAQDTCAVNDICETATAFPGVISDLGFVCIASCNTGATPELINTQCNIGSSPTVWFSIVTDWNASLMNINVKGSDFSIPTISLFQEVNGCNDLIPVSLTASNLPCVMGSNGEADALGTTVGANVTYYIAVGSFTHETGEFDICISTISEASVCVTSRDIEIVARSAGGPLTGPFVPGETVSICMNVNSFSASSNGCQWFQGVVPVFGSGWDPSSFDSNGQPLNATINGNAMGVFGNGLYGTTTWDWFTDVDYHFDNFFYQVGDFDGIGDYELCHVLYEVDCPNTGGLTGGCCGPCWGTPLGDFLPPGWFAYGINGTCPSPGPPVRVDWGDGNTCGGGMGPWNFCFDLTVREYPDCLENEMTSNLSLGFFTFADGETGSWTGSASVCQLDQPAKITLPMQCGQQINLGIEDLPGICSGDSIHYVISYPGVSHWTWSISPGGYVQEPVLEGENNYAIRQLVINPSGITQQITYSFYGIEDVTQNTVIKQVRFNVYPPIQFPFPDITVCERDSVIQLIPQISGGTGNYHYLWSPSGSATPLESIYNPFPASLGLTVTDEAGCLAAGMMHIKTRPCHLMDTDMPDDDDNEPDHPKDPPPPGGNITETPITSRSPGLANNFSIKPTPARDRIIIAMQRSLTAHEMITISDMNGKRIMQYDAGMMQGFNATLDVNALPDGLYIVTLHTAQGPVSRRMVKM